MSECTVRIKHLKSGEHKMVTPEYASRTKMLKNSGWIVESLPEKKEVASTPVVTARKLEVDEPLDEEDLIDSPSFDEALIEKETGVSLDDQPEEEDENIPLSAKVEKEEAKKPKGRQPGSKNKAK